MTAPVAVFGDAMLEPATGEVVRDAVVLIENDRVTAAGARSQVSVPADAKRVDAEGLWLLPGLIDCHVHLCRRPDHSGDVIGVPGNPLEDLNLVAKAENVKLVVKGGAVVKN